MFLKNLFILSSFGLFLCSCGGEESSDTTTSESEVTTTTEEETPKPADKYLYCNVDNLSIRKGPGLDDEKIGALSEGDSVKFIESSENKTKFTLRGKEFETVWHKIETSDGKTGWSFGGGLQEEVYKVPEFKTAEWFDSPEKRTDWWSKISRNWKRALNIMILKKGDTAAQPTDEELQKIFATKELDVNPDGECGESNFEFKLKDLSGIKHLTNLEYLTLSYNEFQDMADIAGLTKLKTLWAEDIQPASWDGIEKLTSLQTLGVGSNKLTSLKPFSTLTSLDGLYFGDNEVRSLVDIKNLTNLKYLSFEGNNVSSFSGIEKLVKLSSIDADYNKFRSVTSTKGFARMKKLRYLSLAGNEDLTDVTPLRDLKHIETIDISYLKLESWKGLEGFKQIWYGYNVEDIPEGEIDRLRENGSEVMQREEICGC